MARKNFAPPSGFVIEETPAAAPSLPQETPAAPVAGLPEGFVLEEAPAAAPEGPAPLEVDVEGGRMPTPEEPEYKEFHPNALAAGFQGLASTATMGLGDEIQGAGAGLRFLLEGRGFGEGYDQGVERARAYRDAAWEENPETYAIGAALGFLPTFALPGGAAANIAGRGARTAALAGVGAGYGALTGAAGADQDRLEGAMIGGGLGAVGGAVLPPLLAAGGNLASRVGQATGLNSVGRNAMASLDSLLTRAPQDAGRLIERAAERRAVGAEPVLADILDEQGAGTLAAAGMRGEARDTAVSWARGRRADLQDRVASQAAPISPESRPVADVVSDIERGRSFVADQEYDAIRSTVVPLTEDLRKVLDTGAGRRELKRAIETSDSPEEVAGFLTALKRGNEPSELDRMMSLLPEGMNASAKAQVRQQLEAQGIKGSPPMPDFTLDMLDRIKRGMQATMRSPDASGLSRQYQRMVERLVEAGDSAAPGYAAARGNFAAQSGLADAAEVGAGILRGNADEFVGAANRLSNDSVAVPLQDEAGRFSMPTVAGPSARDAARMGARRALELEAGEGPKRALGLADRMAYGRNALNRLGALVDEPTAARVQQGMRVTAEDARRANFLDPNAGSKTARMATDLGEDLLETGVNLLGGNKVGILRTVVRRLNNAGIRSVDADRLWTLATDPASTEAAIDYLIQRGARRVEATRIVRSLSARVPGVGGGEAVDN